MVASKALAWSSTGPICSGTDTLLTGITEPSAR